MLEKFIISVEVYGRSVVVRVRRPALRAIRGLARLSVHRWTRRPRQQHVGKGETDTFSERRQGQPRVNKLTL